MELRDRAEHAIRRFHALELANGGDPVIDYDCAPTTEHIEPYPDRFTALDDLTALQQETEGGPVAEQLTAHATYLAALMGERLPLDDYLRRTQGCGADGWSDEYLAHRRDQAKAALTDLGISWGEKCRSDLRALDEQLDPAEVTEVIQQYAAEYESFIRDLAETSAEFNLAVEDVEHDEYWSYWLDGAGHNARLRINRKTASFTRGDAYRFALHEILGHALEYASLTDSAEKQDVPWPRLLAVHSNHQVLFEGLGQFLPVLARPNDPITVATVRLDHHTQLVRGGLHLMVNAGAAVAECLEVALQRAPYLSRSEIERELRDRSSDARLRSYLWSYPSGIDWFVNLWERDANLVAEVIRDAYERPLSPRDLELLSRR